MTVVILIKVAKMDAMILMRSPEDPIIHMTLVVILDDGFVTHMNNFSQLL